MSSAESFRNLKTARDLPGLHEFLHDVDTLGADDVLVTLLPLFEASDVMIAVFDESDRLRASNSAFRRRLCVEVDEAPTWPELMKRNYQHRRGVVIAENADIDGWISSVNSRRGAQGYRISETDFHDGSWALMHEVVLANRWQLVLGTDVTGMKVSGRALRADRDAALKASHTDDLTQISNRRHVLARLAKVIETAAKTGEVGGACLFDIDHFKSINDRYGHVAGDTVLVQVARVVRSTIRFGDAFGRVGGEEFLLVMPKTPIQTCTEVGHRLLETVRMLRPLSEHPDFHLTISGGLTAISRQDTEQTVYARCDAALYAAKERGRDCLVDSRDIVLLAAGSESAKRA